jgi:hypothetical protein
MFKKASKCSWNPSRRRQLSLREKKEILKRLKEQREKDKIPVYCTGDRRKVILRKKQT